jgi:cobalt-zinc-cadmium efflux system protein
MSKNHSHEGHSHAGHAHSHAPVKYDTRFAIAIFLNLAFIIIELYYGKKANSAGLIADALHNLSDVAGLLISWLGVFLARFKKTHNLTFALKNATILASFINAIILIIGVVYIFIEGYKSLITPKEVNTIDVIIVALIGIVINGATAVLFISGAKNDINIKSAFLHMLSDALVSLGVVIAGIAIIYTGFMMIDSIVAIVIGLLILFTSYGLFKESSKLLFLGVPSSIKLKEVEEEILSTEGVISLHDLHIWGISTTENSISVHLIVTEKYNNASLVKNLRAKFNLHHFTIQVEQHDMICDVNC